MNTSFSTYPVVLLNNIGMMRKSHVVSGFKIIFSVDLIKHTMIITSLFSNTIISMFENQFHQMNQAYLMHYS